MNRCSRSFALLLSLLGSTSVLAHHSSAPHFDSSMEVVVEGVVTRMRFVNPHAYLYFDEEKNGELINWRCELTSATQLKRLGWATDTFAIGQKITMSGAPARREENVCYMNSISLRDGTEIARHEDLNLLKQAVAAQVAQVSERPQVLENGQPNLQGPWVSKSFGRNGEGISPDFVATEAGVAALGSYDLAFDDPILSCHIVNVIRGWNHDENVNDIVQGQNSISIKYGFMDFVRTIHLDIDEHPSALQPSTGGHSIGHWEGDTLVVDTIGFEAGVLEHRDGMQHSDQMQVFERFHFDDEREYLVRDYTVIDPLYLVGEIVGQDFMALSSEPYSAYNCVELSGANNIRPTEH